MKHSPEMPPTVVVDTREPHPDAGDPPETCFRPCVLKGGARMPLASVRAKLDVGDYSLLGLENIVAIERKSGPDLLGTLFGAHLDSVGDGRANFDRFRAECERARGLAAFCIVVETSPAWVYAEAGRPGRRFDPNSVFGMLDSLAVDLGVETIWTGTKGLAEVRAGTRLARIWSQANGGEKARDAHKRGYVFIPWLSAPAKPQEGAA